MAIDRFININSCFDYQLFDPKTGSITSTDDLSDIFSPSLAALELSRDLEITIPGKLVDIFSQYRPTPLFRAKHFEKAIGTSCCIYVKNEGMTPVGNHKLNSAYFIAYSCKKDGIKTITTETTGNWGIALAEACRNFGLETICFLDSASHEQRPGIKQAMKKVGAKVKVIEVDHNHNDLITLTADAAIEYTRNLESGIYVFRSVYGYFIVPQTIIGMEAREQLRELGIYPDIVIGSCGGGANLLGICSAFIVDSLESGNQVKIFSAESEHCPILTKGIPGKYSIDRQNFYPLIETCGIKGLLSDEYIGGLGSTIVASAASYFHNKGIIEAEIYTSRNAIEAAKLFYNTEGFLAALESGYQLACVIEKAKLGKKKASW